MKKGKTDSSVNLLAGKANFTDEPYWYRLLVIVIIAVFIMVLVCLIRFWAVPALFAGKLSAIQLGEIYKNIRGPRAP